MESKKSILRILRMLGNCQLDLEVLNHDLMNQLPSEEEIT